MVPVNIMKQLSQKSDKKILHIIIDGVGGLAVNGKTELEAANIPNLDKLASKSITGLAHPVAPGITPGSGPGHLGAFGYDPFKYSFGRGVLSALGSGMDMKEGDVAIRCNFITLSDDGTIADRRAGRIPSDVGKRLVEKLSNEIKKIDDVEIIINHVMEYRFAVVFRGEGLYDNINDTDPQKTGLKPLEAVARDDKSKKMADIANKFFHRAREVLKDEHPANGIVLRGFARKPDIPTMQELYKLNPACIATYPMYKGVARLIGMEIIEGCTTIEDEVNALKREFAKFDYFYFHIKKTDSYGEDGNFDAKVHKLEEFDSLLPQILALGADVIAVTGDHSTPAKLKGHSWHPVPIIIYSENERIDDVNEFNEKACSRGALGYMLASDVMPIILANAGKLKKFGA